MSKSFLTKDDAFRLAFILLTIYFYISLIISAIYLSAPFLGGKFFLFAVIIYGAQAVMAYISKKYLKKVQKKEHISNIERLLIFSYIVLCTFLYLYSVIFG